MKIQNIIDFDTMLQYFGEKLEWNIDLEDFDVDDYTYELEASELNIKEEEFAKISNIYQVAPLTDNMPFGIFAVVFESRRLEIAALRKILSKLVTKKRNNPDYPTWNMHDIIFLCFWGEKQDKYIGIACFDDNNKNLPQLKIEYIQPKNEDFSQIEDFEKKISNFHMPSDISDTENWCKQWKNAFTAVYRSQIADSKNLADKLAELAQNTRQTIIDAYNVETSLGYVHLLYDKFRQNLVHNLEVEQFADMYAQTIAYGLFSARCMDDGDNFNWKEAIDKIPNTNPFLKSLIKSCFEYDSSQGFFDELELSEIINLLNNTNIRNILDYFNRHTGNGREDTVIYFYEDFLSAYEHETKKRRGVYYTPWQVVKFMVRAVNDILKTEFGFADGLADTATKEIKYMHDSMRKNSRGLYGQFEDTEEVPAIQILDPATGTGTFLREVILNIYETFCEKHKGEDIKKLWNEYVPKHLLPRLNGFELMMAPYAVAHMKLAMVLKDTGYDFNSDERLRVMLTNSLEPANDMNMYGDSIQMSFISDPLAMESIDASRTKRNQGINVIIGNPPYSGESANKGKWIMDLMDDYKKEPGSNQKLQERNPKWINDDYVKFIRYAQYCIEKSGQGIVAFINPHGFIDNPTFRGMRWKLLSVFDKIYIIDLHGNAKKKEVCPDGSKDENVFDIQQGVSIVILVKVKEKNSELAEVCHYDMFGLRDEKYSYLRNSLLSDVDFDKVTLSAPDYFMLPKDFSAFEDYNRGFALDKLFEINSVGIVTAKDKILVNDDVSTLKNNVEEYYGITFDTSKVTDFSYRPFDIKKLYYDTSLIERPRTEVMKHMLNNNIGLCFNKVVKTGDTYQHCFITNIAMDSCYVSNRTSEITYLMPLYTYSTIMEKTTREPNLNKEIVQKISEKLNLPFAPDSDGGKTDSFAPIDLLDYIYAVLHSPKYRETYKEFLKTDFPRVPYPTEQEMFWKMVSIGREIRELHLMESTLLDTLITSFNGDGDNTVDKPKYQNGKAYINKNQYFDGVSEAAWNFYIGGYQPLQKWLKDRKGRQLSCDAIIHYQKIVVALVETDRLMKEIDEVFEF